MNVQREELLRALAAVSPGLAGREVVEQATCYCFRDGKVFTFNDEIACSAPCPLPGMTAAVPAKSLLSLLTKLSEPEIGIFIEGGKFVVNGKGKKTRLNMDAQVTIPIESSVEMPQDDAWRALDNDFGEALELTLTCVADDSEKFAYTCVHLMPDCLEGCDNFQFIYYPMTTGLQTEMLIRKKAAKNIIGLGMNAIAETPTWTHFRNAKGLMLSCRRYNDQFPNTRSLLDWQGTKTTLPGGLAEAVARAEIFSSENATGNHVRVMLKPNCEWNLRILGLGQTGEHDERCTVQYDGVPLSFKIAPKLLASLPKSECEVTEGKLRVNGGKWTYVACLFVDEVPAPQESAAAA